MKKRMNLITILTVVYVVCMLLSNIVATKQFALGPWSIPAGTIVFPITYILSDVFSEVYGYKWSRITSWLAAAMNLFMCVIFWLTIAIPGPIWFAAEIQTAMQIVLGNTPRLVIAGLIAYVVGDWVNDLIFELMRKGKQIDKNTTVRYTFFSRAILSSFFGELCDSTIFICLAFVGTMPAEQLPSMIIIQVIAKTLYEIVIFPITNKIMKEVKKYESVSGT